MSFLCYNGKFLPANEPVLLAVNRGYRYGDGMFETMRIREGNILLANYHFERLFDSLAILQFDTPPELNVQRLTGEILELCRLNECHHAARVRLSMSRGNGGFSFAGLQTEYIIECSGLIDPVYKMNAEGRHIDVYPDARKSCDRFARLKSANFLPYVMAARFAADNHLDDALVLNTYETIADSTIANIFIIKDEKLITPALDQGCVAGVMRRNLIESLQGTRYKVQEEVVTISNLENADEIFLTNAITGIQCVGTFRNKKFRNIQTRQIFDEFVNIA